MNGCERRSTAVPTATSPTGSTTRPSTRTAASSWRWPSSGRRASGNAT